jgi:hypothetical protein
MKQKNKWISALILSTGLIMTMAANCSFNWLDIVKIQSDVYYSDGVTPYVGLNVDALDITFFLDDGIDVTRRIDFTYAQALGCNLSTGTIDPDKGIMHCKTGDLDISAQVVETECENICTDRDDETGVCVTYIRRCDDVLRTRHYTVLDIKNSSAQLTIRGAGGAVITMPAIKIQHQLVETKNDDKSGTRAWLQHDKFVTPFLAISASKAQGGKSPVDSLSAGQISAVKAYPGEPQVIPYEKASPAQKAKVDKVVDYLMNIGLAPADGAAGAASK